MKAEFRDMKLDRARDRLVAAYCISMVITIVGGAMVAVLLLNAGML